MELARIILRLWKLRAWVAIGAVMALAIGFAMTKLAGSTVYAAASTQMVVDAPRSVLGDAQTDLTPFTSRAVVFSRLMTSPQALQYIGKAARIPGSLIEAAGPTEIGMPQAIHTPSGLQSGKIVAPTAEYKLRFDQNPALPTVDIYSQAPTTHEAISLANGAVTGFAAYLNVLETSGDVPGGSRVKVRQLGGATGGVVDSGASKKIAALAAFAVLGLWCCGVLFVSRLRQEIRIAKGERGLERVSDAPAPDGVQDTGPPLFGDLPAPNDTLQPDDIAMSESDMARYLAEPESSRR